MQTNHPFNKKNKKTPKLSKNHIFLGIPANIAAGPLGFRAELDIGPKGEQSRSYRDLEADGSDPTGVRRGQRQGFTDRIPGK